MRGVDKKANFQGKFSIFSNRKKSVSDIVAVILLILLVLILIFILWLVVLPFLVNGSLENVHDIYINFAEGYTCYDAANKVTHLQIEKGPEPVKLSGVLVVFIKGGNSHKFYTDAPELNSKKVFSFNITGRFDEVKVAPVIKIGNKFSVGAFTSSGKIQDCAKALPIPPGILQEDCGDGKCTSNETCSGCSMDCGVCPIFCGDEICNGDESIFSCSQDCCAAELSPGVDNIIYDAINNAPISSLEGYNQYVICLGPGEPGEEYEEPSFGAYSDSFWSNKNGITLLGLGGRAVIDLQERDAINVHSEFVTLENLEIKNAKTQGAIAKNNNFKFINNIVHDVGKDGLQLNPSSGHIVINNTFYNVVEDAIACNGCRDAIISHNYIWKGIGLPLNQSKYGGIYLYTSQGGYVSNIDLNCNLIGEPNLGGGELPAGIRIDLESESSIKVIRNFINNSIVYASINLNGPILLNKQSSFVFEDNYCNQTASYCLDENGNSYECCNFASENKYDEWHSVCGDVGAY